MTFSMAEMFLLVWAVVATLGYGYLRGELRKHVMCPRLIRVSCLLIMVSNIKDLTLKQSFLTGTILSLLSLM